MTLLNPSLTTPCAVVDLKKLKLNVQRLKSKLVGSGVVLRPHLKTIKCHEAALLVLDSPRGPATVSTLREAEAFGQRGVTDILYAVGIAPQKLARVTEIRRSGIDLKVILDSLEMATAMAEYVANTGETIPTLIEIDVDGKRAGVPADDETALLSIARRLDDAGCLKGVMSYSGGSYNARDKNAIDATARREQEATASMANALRRSHFVCEYVSIGSTPAALSLAEFDGITEVRAGVFMFFDLYQAGLGVCSVDDIALSVLATVIGHRKGKGWIFVDAGWTALSADRSTAAQAVDYRYGMACDINCRPYGDLVVMETNQEHGIIASRSGSKAFVPDLPVGSRVRILPNHACATATQHEE